MKSYGFILLWFCTLIKTDYSYPVRSPVITIHPRDWFIYASQKPKSLLSQPPLIPNIPIAFFNCSANSSTPVEYSWYYATSTCIEYVGKKCRQGYNKPIQISENNTQYKYFGNKKHLFILDKSMDFPRLHFCVASNIYGSVRSMAAFAVRVKVGGDEILIRISNGALLPCDYSYTPSNYVRINRNWNIKYRWYDTKNQTLYNTSTKIGSFLVVKDLLELWNKSKNYVITCLASYFDEITKAEETLYKVKFLFNETTDIDDTFHPLYIFGVVEKNYMKNPPIYSGLTIMEGAKLELNCIAMNTTMPSQYIWYHNSSLLLSMSSRIRFNDKNDRLVIQWAVVEDSGKFCCNNNVTKFQTCFQLKVIPNVTFADPITQYYITKNNMTTDLIYKCNTNKYKYKKETFKINWLVNNTLIIENEPGIQIIDKNNYSELKISRSSNLYNSEIVQCYFDRMLQYLSVGNHRPIVHDIISFYKVEYESIIEEKIQINLLPSGETYQFNPDDQSSLAIFVMAKTTEATITNVSCQISTCSMNPCGLFLKESAKNEKTNVTRYVFESNIESTEKFISINVTIKCSAVSGKIMYTGHKNISVINCEHNCQPIDKRLFELMNLTSMPIDSVDKANKAALLLQNVTTEADTFSSMEVVLTLELLGKIISYKKVRDIPEETVASILNNILNVNESIMLQSENVGDSGFTLLDQIATFSDQILENNGKLDRILISTHNLNVASVARNISEMASSKYFYFSRSNTQAKAQLTFPMDSRFTQNHKNQIGIALNKNAIDDSKISFYLISNAMLTSVQEKAKHGGNASVILTPLISARVKLHYNKKYTTDVLLNPVIITVRHDKLMAKQVPKCVFWIESNSTWSSQGCYTISKNDTQTVCGCNHLTNFALLLSFSDTEVSPTHSRALSILTYIGLGLSSICLFLTLVIYSAYHKHVSRHSHPTRSQLIPIRIIICFSLTLLCSNIIFLTSSWYHYPGKICTAIGALLHYFYLSVFAWSFVQSFQLFNSIIYLAVRQQSVLGIYISHFFIKSCVFAWGFPLITVVVTLVTNSFQNYGTMQHSFESKIIQNNVGNSICFLTRPAIYISFLAPTGLILLLDFIIFIAIVMVLIRHKSEKQIYTRSSSQSLNTGSQQRNSQKNRGLGGLIFLLSLSWLLGFLQIGEASIFFQYLFVLSTTLQGVFIFFFYCLLKQDVKKFVTFFSSTTNATSSFGVSSSSSTKERQKKLSVHIQKGNSIDLVQYKKTVA